MAKQQVQETENKKSGCSLQIFDIFALTTGSVGFVVDIITLATLFLTSINLNADQKINESALPTIPGILALFLILLYSWFAISWYATRRDYRHIVGNNATVVPNKIITTWSNRTFAVVGALGALTFPLWLMWLFFVVIISNPSLADDLLNYIGNIIISGIVGIGIVGIIVVGVYSEILKTLMPVAYSDMLVIDEDGDDKFDL